MSKIVDFYIEFKSKWGIYQPGEEVSGKVVINLADSIVCDSILLNIYGSARVMWVERKMWDNRYQSVPYRQEIVYVDHQRTIWEASIEESNRRPKPMGALQLFTSGGRLQGGKRQYKFSYQLPDDLPTSFEAAGVPCFVRYYAKASLVTNGCARVSKKEPFCVCSTVDLPSVYPLAANRFSVDDTFALPRSRFPRVEGQISVSIELPKSGFVPGEPIPVKVLTENNSTKAIKFIVCSFRLRALVEASEPEPIVKEIEKVVAENRTYLAPTSNGRKSPEKFQKFNETECMIYIPAVSPNIRITGLLETKYVLQIEVVYSSTRAPIVMRVPVIVGTVPLVPVTAGEQRRREAAANRESLFDAALPSTSTDFPAPPPDEERPPLPNYDDVLATVGLPPPTYEESVMGNFEYATEQEQQPSTADVASLPKYKVYHFQAI